LALEKNGIIGVKKAESTKNKASSDFKPFKISQKVLPPKKPLELEAVARVEKKEVQPVKVKLEKVFPS